MIGIRQLSAQRWLVLLILSCSILGQVTGKKDKETPMPSMAPSYSPTPVPTQSPSETPTMDPSQYPSIAPTKAPTVFPTATPTMDPSFLPTAGPTSSLSVPSPTAYPTATPTNEMPSTPAPSPIEINEPSSTPTDQETTVPTTAVDMPRIELLFAMSDRDAADDKLMDLEVGLEMFFEGILDSQPGFDDFTKLDLQVVVAQFAGRRRLDVGLRFALIGKVFYDKSGQTPSKAEVDKILKSYFSFWGLEELATFMTKDIGFESVRGLSLTIGDTTYETEGDNLDDSIFPVNSDIDEPRSSSDAGLEVSIVIGIVAGCTFFVLLIIIGLAYNARKESEKLKKHEAYLGFDDGESLTGSSEKLEAQEHSSPEAPTPQMPPPPSSADDTPSDLSVVSSLSNPTFSMMSIDSSMFTSDLPSFVTSHGSDKDDSNNSSSDSYLQYDVTRLDKVIAAAKQTASSDKKETTERQLLNI